MIDLHSTLDYIYKRLQIKYEASIYSPNEKDSGLYKKDWLRTFLLKIDIEKDCFDLIIAFPKGFPYKYPKIYLHNRHSDLINMPHIDKKFYICTYDEEEAIPNVYKPLEVSEKVIKKAVSIIKDGLYGKNFKDYEEEFLAYWSENALREDVLSIVEKTKEIKDIIVFDIKDFNIFSYKYLVADSYAQGINWLKNANLLPKDRPIYNDRGLYFPIQTAAFNIIPKTNIELLQFLHGNKLKDFYKGLNNKKRPTLVIADYKDSFFAFEIQEFYEKVIKKGRKAYRKYQKGFRPGKQLTFMELSGYAKYNNIKRYNVERFDKLRLFERGGEGLTINQNYKINLLGCGSVGSFLLEKLIQVGFNNFNIIDSDILRPENLTRHVCSIEDLFRKKAEALSDNLHKRFPHAVINAYKEDIYDLIKDNITIFNDVDLNIICVGDYNIELLISTLQNEGFINKPILIIWVESYIKAGHFLYIKQGADIDYEELHQFDSKGLKYQYAISSDTFKKREAGCQSTYIPYGSLNISIFVNYIVYLIQEISKGNIKTSCIYRWNNNDNIINATMERII